MNEAKRNELTQPNGSARLDGLRSWVAWRVRYEKHPSWTKKEQIKMAKACCALEDKVELLEKRVEDFRAWVEASDCPLDVDQTLITLDECFPSQNVKGLAPAVNNQTVSNERSNPIESRGSDNSHRGAG